ncbi:MAG: 50S ribosomal protein L25/general stress protein Ctc [Proteobacteria bacterium]|nr:50S ribosomal protein L25/general stress protein Ctc [Pseudomonadota bacterium]
MAEMPTIEATSRKGVGKGAARAARRDGFVPGVVYGGGQDPVSINIKHNVLLKALKAGKFLSTLINLKLDGADTRVICRGVQRHVVRDLPIHADFLRLSENSRINLLIPVEFQNEEEAPGLRKGGVLTIVRGEIELKVRAGEIPDHIAVDLSGLEIGDTVKISDITLPAGTAATITDRDFMIANISAPSVLLTKEEVEAAEAEAEEAIEGVEGEIEDGAEGEGEGEPEAGGEA